MGCWSVNCGISNIAITYGHECVILPIKKDDNNETRKYVPATLPIFGKYNDYGGMEDIEIDDNTKLIEEHFGITIDEFVEFLVDGKYTYEREEAEEIGKKVQNHFEEMKKLRFMWIDRQVYDFMINDLDDYHKGYNDYGTPEMLTLLGFEFIEKSNEYPNYDPKRFNQLWRKGDLDIYSDGRTILTKDNRYVYHFGKGDETSIETYFDVPEGFMYLKDISKNESWRLMDKKRIKQHMGWILGLSRYSYLDYLPDFSVEKKDLKLHERYFEEMDTYGDRIVQLLNVSKNLNPMSGRFSPHELYLTPQCGDFRTHQILLEKFVEINKSYIEEE
jgi:hypothetical protein